MQSNEICHGKYKYTITLIFEWHLIDETDCIMLQHVHTTEQLRFSIGFYLSFWQSALCTLLSTAVKYGNYLHLIFWYEIDIGININIDNRHGVCIVPASLLLLISYKSMVENWIQTAVRYRVRGSASERQTIKMQITFSLYQVSAVIFRYTDHLGGLCVCVFLCTASVKWNSFCVCTLDAKSNLHIHKIAYVK